MTTDELHDLYQNGDITYWDFLFCYYILVGESVAYALNVANTYKPGESITENGYSIAVQILTQLGRQGEIKYIPAAYSWQVIAEASSPEKLKTATPKVSEIAVGTKGMVKVDTNWGAGHIFDTYGAEWFGKYFSPTGAKVTDVYYEGGISKGHGIIEYVVTGSGIAQSAGYSGSYGVLFAAVIPILLAAAAALAALGIALGAVAVLIYGPKVISEIGKAGTNWLMWGAIGAVGVAAIMVLGEKRKAAS